MERDGLYSVYKLNRYAPSVSHIMFAYDVMLFGKVYNTTIYSVSSILQEYYSVSGQLVNYNKSSIHFSKKVDDDRCEEIIAELGVCRITKDEKYL